MKKEINYIGLDKIRSDEEFNLITDHLLKTTGELYSLLRSTPDLKEKKFREKRKLMNKEIRHLTKLSKNYLRELKGLPPK